MTAPRSGPDPASMRGVAILAVAVVLGFLLLGGSDELGLSTTSKSSGAGDDTSTTSTSFTVPEQAPTTAPVGGAAAKPPGEVKVIVLNGSGGLAKGVAGSSTEKLDGLGYETLDPSNAEARDKTLVQYAEGFEGNAQAINIALGLGGTVELKAAEPIAEAQDAQIIVILGKDAAALVAGGSTATTAPTTPTTAGD